MPLLQPLLRPSNPLFGAQILLLDPSLLRLNPWLLSLAPPCRPCYHALVLTVPSLDPSHLVSRAIFSYFPPLKDSAPAGSALLCSYTLPSRTSSLLKFPPLPPLPSQPLPTPPPRFPTTAFGSFWTQGPSYRSGILNGDRWRIAYRLVLVLWNTHCMHPARTVQFLIKATAVSPRFFCHSASPLFVQTTTRSLISRPVDRKADRFVVSKLRCCLSAHHCRVVYS